MKLKLFIIVLAFGVVLSLMFICRNQCPLKNENARKARDHNLGFKNDPQVTKVQKDSNSDQIKAHMDDYHAKLIQKAEKLIDRAKSVPSGIDPMVETEGDFTVVFWRIPRDGGKLVPGPSKYAAVYFRKGTLDLEGVLGPH